MRDLENRTPYLTYNGLARSAMPFGIPYMVLMSILSLSGMGSMLAGNYFGPTGWLAGLLGLPILAFIKTISMTDDKAMHILKLELFWFMRKFFFGNTQFFGGAMLIAPASYKRKYQDVKRAFEATTRRARLPARLRIPRN